MKGTCIAQRERKKLATKLKKRGQLRVLDVGVEGKIILKRILKKEAKYVY
jgi:hypothetical protein